MGAINLFGGWAGAGVLKRLEDPGPPSGVSASPPEQGAPKLLRFAIPSPLSPWSARSSRPLLERRPLPVPLDALSLLELPSASARVKRLRGGLRA